MSIESVQSRIYAIESRFQQLSAVNNYYRFNENNNKKANIDNASIVEDSSKIKSIDKKTAIKTYAKEVKRNSTASATTEKTSFDELFQKAAAKYNVDPSLIKAVAKAESDFNSNLVASSGASGIMQLMPGTARSLGVSNVLDPASNIDGGTKYLKQMLDNYNGDVNLALAAYNAGPGNVKKYGGVPPFTETQNYIKKVQNYYQQMK